MIYIIGTSLGNIEDTSLRAVKTLATCDELYVEDTRTFHTYYSRIQELFRVYTKKEQKVYSFHDQNEFERVSQIIQSSEAGKTVGIVSEAGMPVISDPGSLLIGKLHTAGIEFDVIPGPTALTTALTFAGIASFDMRFLGFLPHKQSHIQKRLQKHIDSKNKDTCLICYESPHRILKTLQTIDDIYPEAHITVCRELTKTYQEILRGTPAQLLADRTGFKGEITLVIEL